MRLTIFGATRNTGKHVMEQALAAGHEVIAVARNPAAITLEHDCLHLVKGDVVEFPTIQSAVRGSDAVISTIGVTGNAPTTLYSEGTANIIRAMEMASVRRLICLSASGLDPGPWWQQHLAKPLLWAMFKHGYSDMLVMESIVKQSDLDWTIIRPPRLTDGARTDHVHEAINQQLKRGWKISRADLAAYILAQLANRAIFRGVIEVAN
jgi:putative NADH-flavin reductase